MVAFVMAKLALEKFGGDSAGELSRNYQGYLEQIRDFKKDIPVAWFTQLLNFQIPSCSGRLSPSLCLTRI